MKKIVEIEEISNLANLFKQEDGLPLKLTTGQKEIFETIVLKKKRRVQCICITQYGKSMTISLATIVRAITFPESWCIIGATEKKARIIMDYVIGHLFDNPLFESQLELEGETNFERLKRERSRNKLTFKRGGKILILSAQTRNKKAVIEALTGFGAKNIIIDDSVLIPDDSYVMIKRMLGGHKDNFLFETGNPFKRNHFFKTYNNPSYKKIIINWVQAVKEGRVTMEFIEEMRKEMFFDVLYECQFPDASNIDEEGYQNLIKYEDIEFAISKNRIPNDETLIENLLAIRWKLNSSGQIQIEPKEKMRLNGNDSPDFSDALSLTFFDNNEYGNFRKLGVDVASGINKNVYILRTLTECKIIDSDNIKDTMVTVGKIKKIIDEEKLKPYEVYIDKTGLGVGIYDRLIEQGYNVNGVMEAQTASKKEFFNKRAEMYWKLKEWLTATNLSTQKIENDIKITGIHTIESANIYNY